MTNVSQVPRIGVGVFVLNSKNEFVFGKRKGSHGHGTWALPGGHLELHESFEECARREVMEETGLEIDNIKFWTATNSPRIDGSKHYVTIFMVSKLVDPNAQPELMEPQKCDGWQWMSWDIMLEWCNENQSETLRSDGKAAEEHNLFLPMIDLVLQRPGQRPSLDL